MIRRIAPLLTLMLVTAAPAAEFRVAPDGDDAGPGTDAQPFATLLKARDALRQAGADGGTIWIHGGTYRLSEPLDLGEADSGGTWRAVDGEAVWLTGAVPVPTAELQPVTDPALLSRLDPVSRGRVRQWAIPAEVRERLAPEWPDTWWIFDRNVTALNELFSGAARLPMARWPNEDYTTFGEILKPGEEGEPPTFQYLGDRPARWASAVDDGLWLYGYWRRGYRAEFVKVKSLTPETATIELAARHSLGNLETGGASRYCAMHVLEELDAPGEWYLDRRRGLLLVWPPEDGAPLNFSLNPTAVIQSRGGERITLRGLGFEGSAGAGILIEGGNGVNVVGCEVRNVGTHGVVAKGTGHRVVGCDIHDTGDKAIVMDAGDRTTLTAGNAVIDNCHLHHTNRIVRAGSQAVSLDGVGNRLSHCLIHDTGYIAVRFAGNDHVLEYNRLFRTNVESAEGGVFYTGRDWTSRGSVIRYNFIHHVQDSVEGAGSSTRFVHLDDSAPEIEIHGNVCYRLGGGVSICGGAANRVHDNLFVECAWGVDIGPRGADMFESDGQGGFIETGSHSGWNTLVRRLIQYKWNQPPYSTQYPKLIEIFAKEPIAAPWFNVVERNVMVDCGSGIRELNMQPGWSTVADNWEGDAPGFLDPDHTKLDFRLKPDAAPVREVGYRPPPLAEIGLYESPERRTWPVQLDLPAAAWKPRWMHLRDEAKKGPQGLPVFRVMAATAPIVIDGVVDPMEWTPGDATGRAPEIHETAELAATPDGDARYPSQAMLQTDEEHLYVHFRNPIDPAKGLSGGHRWGQDDAVEIALAEVAGGEMGAILLLRGYADGAFESSYESGAPAAAVARVTEGVRYAAKPAGPGLWCAEWSIPFRALGIDPATRNPRLVFNLAVRKPGSDEWVMWRRTGGRTWEIQKAGFLWLAQFGDMAPPAASRPSVARIDLDGRRDELPLIAGAGCKLQEWAKPLGCYLSATADNLPTDSWRELTFRFTPEKDGTILLKLMGEGVAVPGTDQYLPIWVYSDDLRVEGAELVNGDFEQADGQVPAGWRADLDGGLWIRDPKLAASGEWCAKTSHNHRFTQSLKLTAGREVVVRVKVRGVPLQ